MKNGNNGEKHNNKILGNGKKPSKNLFKKKKIKEPGNRKRCVEDAKGKCVDCGSKNGVAAHHIIFKGEGGDDSPDNLIALCFNCHRKAHDGFYLTVNTEGYDKPILFVTPKQYIIKLLNRVDLVDFYIYTLEERLRR